MYYTSFNDDNELVDYLIPCYVYKCQKCRYETTTDRYTECSKCHVKFVSHSIFYKFFNNQLYRVYGKEGNESYKCIRGMYKCNLCKDLRKTDGTIKILSYVKKLQKNDEFYYDGYKIVFVNNVEPSHKKTEVKNEPKKIIIKRDDGTEIVKDTFKLNEFKYDFTIAREFNKTQVAICNDLECFIKYVTSHSCYASLPYFITVLENDFSKSIFNLEVDDDEDDKETIQYLNIMKTLIQYVQSVCKYYNEVYKRCQSKTIKGLSKADIEIILKSKINTSKYLNYTLPTTFTNYKEMADNIYKYISSINY